jgi:hypothetical protein
MNMRKRRHRALAVVSTIMASMQLKTSFIAHVQRQHQKFPSFPLPFREEQTAIGNTSELHDRSRTTSNPEANSAGLQLASCDAVPEQSVHAGATTDLI